MEVAERINEKIEEVQNFFMMDVLSFLFCFDNGLPEEVRICHHESLLVGLRWESNVVVPLVIRLALSSLFLRDDIDLTRTSPIELI